MVCRYDTREHARCAFVSLVLSIHYMLNKCEQIHEWMSEWDSALLSCAPCHAPQFQGMCFHWIDLSRKELGLCYKLFSWRLDPRGQFSFISFTRIWKSAPFFATCWRMVYMGQGIVEEDSEPWWSSEGMQCKEILEDKKRRGQKGRCSWMSIGNRLSVTDRQLLAQINILYQLLDTLNSWLSSSHALCKRLCTFKSFLILRI